MAGQDTYINIWEPTFRTEAVEEERFYPSQARELALGVMNQELANQEYDEDDAKEWANNISDKVRDAIAGLNLPRYKIVVQTSIGQCKDQGIRIASRCLWDTQSDNYASAEYINKNMFCTVIIFALYSD
jgi:tctex1 domain-containing protein 2